jgi:hypothetical protein
MKPTLVLHARELRKHARKIADGIACEHAHGCCVVARPVPNPTLVAHGLVKASRWHIVTQSPRRAVADLYVGSQAEAARITRLFANLLSKGGEPVTLELLDNTATPADLKAHRKSVIESHAPAPSLNPTRSKAGRFRRKHYREHTSRKMRRSSGAVLRRARSLRGPKASRISPARSLPKAMYYRQRHEQRLSARTQNQGDRTHLQGLPTRLDALKTERGLHRVGLKTQGIVKRGKRWHVIVDPRSPRANPKGLNFQKVRADSLKVGDIVMPPERELRLWMGKRAAEKGMKPQDLGIMLTSVREGASDKTGRWILLTGYLQDRWYADYAGGKQHPMTFKARPDTMWPVVATPTENPSRSKAARRGRTAKRRAYGSSRARRAADARARAIRAGGTGKSELLARFGCIIARRRPNPKGLVWKTGKKLSLGRRSFNGWRAETPVGDYYITPQRAQTHAQVMAGDKEPAKGKLLGYTVQLNSNHVLENGYRWMDLGSFEPQRLHEAKARAALDYAARTGPRTNPKGRKLQADVSVGDIVSLNVGQHFGRYATVEKIGSEWITVRVHLTEKTLRVKPGMYHISNPSHFKPGVFDAGTDTPTVLLNNGWIVVRWPNKDYAKTYLGRAQAEKAMAKLPDRHLFTVARPAAGRSFYIVVPSSIGRGFRNPRGYKLTPADFVNKLHANADAYHHGRVTHAVFHKANAAIWKAIQCAGLESPVLAAIRKDLPIPGLMRNPKGRKHHEFHGGYVAKDGHVVLTQAQWASAPLKSKATLTGQARTEFGSTRAIAVRGAWRPVRIANPDAIAAALEDWSSGQAYVDDRGNYHLKGMSKHPGEARGKSRIAPWNKAAKAAFKSVREFHAAAHGRARNPKGRNPVGRSGERTVATHVRDLKWNADAYHKGVISHAEFDKLNHATWSAIERRGAAFKVRVLKALSRNPRGLNPIPRSIDHRSIRSITRGGKRIQHEVAAVQSRHAPREPEDGWRSSRDYS